MRPHHRSRALRYLGATGALLLALTACGGGEDDDTAALRERVEELEAQQQASPPADPEPAEPAPTQAEPSAEPTEESPTVDFTMPDLVGENLQVAQNRVQELGVFYSVSHDLLGERLQAMDGNWQVCDQEPAAGARVTGPASDWEGAIDFGVVKLSESCP